MAASLDFDRYPRARGVFHEVLLAHLNEQGASTVDELETREFEWFHLPFNREEIAEVVESARRHGLVAPLGQPVDGHNHRVQGIEWAPTERGARLSRPAVLSRHDVLADLKSGPAVLRELTGAVALVFGAAALKRLSDQGVVRAGTAVAVATLVLLLLIARSRHNDERLRDAAKAWPRLADARPKFYAWQTGVWRIWARLGAWLVILAAAGLAVADVIGDTLLGLGVLAGAVVLGALRLNRADWEQEAALAPLTDYAESQKRLAAGRPD